MGNTPPVSGTVTSRSSRCAVESWKKLPLRGWTISPSVAMIVASRPPVSMKKLEAAALAGRSGSASSNFRSAPKENRIGGNLLAK